MRQWVKHEQEFTNREWTRRCQGVARDGTRWFFSSNVERDPAIYRLSSSMNIEKKRSIHRSTANHVGDVDVHEDAVYVALEHPFQVAVFDTDLNPERLISVSPPPDSDSPPTTHFAWCAVNPWNGLLYSSNWNGADTLHAYDRMTGSRSPAHDIALKGRIDRVQGGCFSPNGRVYLASDDEEGEAGIHGFGLLSGRKLGRILIEIHQPPHPKREEAEGIGFGLAGSSENGTHVHFVLLDMDPFSRDDIHFKSYQAPDPRAV